MGCRTIIARHVAKSGIAQMCLCEPKCQGGWLGGILTSLSEGREWGVGSVVVEAAFFWGAPMFSPDSRGPPKPLLLRVSERFGAKIWGAPNQKKPHAVKVQIVL